MCDTTAKSGDRSGIFAGNDPFEIFKSWLHEAKKHEINDPDAMALSTVDDNGMPNVRMVLLKEIRENSFVFYTNYHSTKGREITGSGKVAFVMHWKSLRRQIRVRGAAVREEGAAADVYFASRSRESQLGAWASAQSSPLSGRAALMQSLRSVRETYAQTTPPRPPHWGGFEIKPLEIEFWADGDARLHDRFLSKRNAFNQGWKWERLAP